MASSTLGPSVGGGGLRCSLSVLSQIKFQAGYRTSPNSHVRVVGPEFARSGIFNTDIFAGGRPVGKFEKHAPVVG